MRIVLAGATGFLGRPLVRALRADGHDVVILTRGQASAHEAGQVLWDPDGSVGAWAAAVEGADAVVNLAGESIAGGRWTAARKEALASSRILSTRSLVGAIESARRPPGLLANASAVGFYGPRRDEIVTEDDPAGADFLGRLADQWEHEARRAAAAGIRVVLLRSGLVLGPNGGALRPMLWPFRCGAGGRLGSGRQYWPWIHLDDWTRLVAFLLSHPTFAGPVNLTAPAPVTNAEFTRVLGGVLHRPAVLAVPAFALRLAMGEMADGLLLGGQRAVPQAATTLGFTFRFADLRAALQQILSG